MVHPRSLRALACGAAAVVLYLAGASISSHLTPLARHPLLDGFVYKPPYRWVKPPPALAAANKAPITGGFVVNLNPQTGSEANAYITSDNQISLGLAQGAIAALSGQGSVKLVMTPLDPARYAAAPAGMTIVGNVYRVRATYQPGGAPVTRLAPPGQLVLYYPAPANALVYRHTILQSIDGRSWRALPTIDSSINQQAQADVPSLGYFAVAQATSGGTRPHRSSSGGILTIAIWAGAGVVVAGLIIAEWRYRRRRRGARGARGAGGRAAPPRRRRPPSRRR